MGKRTFENPEIPAFAKTIDPAITVIPHKNEAGRVIFDLEGSNLEALIQRFYENPEIRILTFLKELRSLRSAIFNLKAEGR